MSTAAAEQMGLPKEKPAEFTLRVMLDEEPSPRQMGPAVGACRHARIMLEVKYALDEDAQKRLRRQLWAMESGAVIDVDDPRGDADRFWRVARTR